MVRIISVQDIELSTSCASDLDAADGISYENSTPIPSRTPPKVLYAEAEVVEDDVVDLLADFNL